jgi:sugar/nucleoside kinase (ribokinase family)
MTGRLLHTGNAVIDVVLEVPYLPERGGDVLAKRTSTTPGGGHNVMAAAARQGAAVVYAGAHGSGPFGDRARAALRAEGIEILLPPRADLDTGFVTCLIDPEGERTFVTSPGAEATLGPDDLDALKPAPDDVVYITGYSLMYPPNRAAISAWLPEIDASATVVVDPGPLADQISAPTMDLMLTRADWFSCNSREATLLTGQDDPGDAARALARRLTRGSALVRTGADGCLLLRNGALDGALDVVPGFAVDAVDLNGAGDAHTGTFIAALLHGRDPRTAARHANAAAALATTARGPATAPDAHALAEFLRSRGSDPKP